ncbi:MAG: universal stress protein [Betaproteobacteria bacterium]|nr:universal stress protein [Betaproteobacteria bacterium]
MSLPAGTSAKDIARIAVDQACELIVVAHRGSNAVMRLLTGSLIPGLITAAATPVLICREPEHPPKRRTAAAPSSPPGRRSGAAAARAAHGH